jgi:hypothetical protein
MLLLGSVEVVGRNPLRRRSPAPVLVLKANGNRQISPTMGESFLGPPHGYVNITGQLKGDRHLGRDNVSPREVEEYLLTGTSETSRHRSTRRVTR